MAVCAVSAVPTNRASTDSLSEVEKTPESAITAAPQINKKGTEPKSERRRRSVTPRSTRH